MNSFFNLVKRSHSLFFCLYKVMLARLWNGPGHLFVEVIGLPFEAWKSAWAIGKMLGYNVVRSRPIFSLASQSYPLHWVWLKDTVKDLAQSLCWFSVIKSPGRRKTSSLLVKVPLALCNMFLKTLVEPSASWDWCSYHYQIIHDGSDEGLLNTSLGQGAPSLRICWLMVKGSLKF